MPGFTTVTLVLGLFLVGLSDAKRYPKMYRTNTTSFSTTASLSEEISFSMSVSDETASSSYSSSLTLTPTITPPPTATQTYSLSVSVSETEISQSFSSSYTVGSLTLGTHSQSQSRSASAAEESASISTTASITTTVSETLSSSWKPPAPLASVPPPPPMTPVPLRLQTLYDVADCAAAATCSSQFRQCAAFSEDCANVASCAQQRIACVNELSIDTGSCGNLSAIKSALLKVSSGSEAYYPASVSYLSCRAAAASWFEDLNLQQQCRNEQHLTEACRAPVSSNLTISFQGAFRFYAGSGPQSRFVSAVLVDMNKTFFPAKVFVAQAFRLVPISRRQNQMMLFLQVIVDGINSSSQPFRQTVAALALNPQAYFSMTAAVYSELTDGDLFVVAAISLGTLDPIDGFSVSNYNYTLSPQSTAASSPRSTAPATPLPSTTTPTSGNTTADASVPADQLSLRDRNLIIGFGVVVSVALIALLVASALLLWRRRRRQESKKDALPPLEEPSPAVLVPDDEAAMDLSVEEPQQQEVVIDVRLDAIGGDLGAEVSSRGAVNGDAEHPPADAHSHSSTMQSMSE